MEALLEALNIPLPTYSIKDDFVLQKTTLTFPTPYKTKKGIKRELSTEENEEDNQKRKKKKYS